MSRSALSQILLCGFVTFSLVRSLAAQDHAAATLAIPAQYQKWLDEDVVYIITEKERTEFTNLGTDQERDQFIEDFWQSRNPYVTPEWNAFKEEHYRRLAYANEEFAASLPGWKTDRGRIYIIYGPPDEWEKNPARHGPMLHSPEQAPSIFHHRNEVWRYNFIHGLGRNVFFNFVDQCECGEFQLIRDPTQRKVPRSQHYEKLVPVKQFIG